MRHFPEASVSIVHWPLPTLWLWRLRLPPTILTTIEALQAEDRAALVIKTLAGRKHSGDGGRRLDKRIDRDVKVSGFREAHSRPIEDLAVAVTAALTDRRDLAAHMAFAWREGLPGLLAAVEAIAEARSLRTVKDPADLLGPLTRFADDELEGIVASLRRDHPQLAAVDVALMCCIVLARCPSRDDGLRPARFELIDAPAQSETVPAPRPAASAPRAPEPSAITSAQLLRWDGLLQAAAAWPAGAPEWDLSTRFTERIVALSAERVATRDLPRKRVAALLKTLRSDHAKTLDYLSFASELDRWSVDEVPSPSLDELASSLQRMVELAQAVKDLPPVGKNLRADEERLRQLLDLKCQIEKALDRARATLSVPALGASPEGVEFAPADQPSTDAGAPGAPDLRHRAKASTESVEAPSKAVEDSVADATVAAPDLDPEQEAAPPSLPNAPAQPDATSSAPPVVTSSGPAAPEPEADPLPQADFPAPNKAIAAQPTANPTPPAGTSSGGPVAALLTKAEVPTSAASTPQKPDALPVGRTLPPAPKEIPPELRSWDAYHTSHWVGPSGSCEPAPWLASTFREVLAAAQLRELRAGHLGRLWLLSRAAELIQVTPSMDPADIASVGALVGRPDSLSAGIDAARSAALRSESVDAGSRWKVKLFLESVRPSPVEPLLPDEVRSLSELVRFEDGGLRHLIGALFRVGARGTDPVAALQASLEDEKVTPAGAAKRLAQAREHFYLEVRANWAAAGGRVERTHCRAAWTQFIEAVSPLFRQLYPPERGGVARWNPETLSREIAGIVSTHDAIADQNGAQFADRARMDRQARHLADAAGWVNWWATRAWQPEDKSDPLAEIFSPQQTRSFLTGPPLAAPEEELCRKAIAAQVLRVGSRTAYEPLVLRYADFLECPDLLATIRSLELVDPTADTWLLTSAVVPATTVYDPLRAAAFLTSEPLSIPLAAREHPESHLAALLSAPHRRWLNPVARRLLGRCIPRPGEALDVYEAIGRLRESYRTLSELAHGHSEDFREVLSSAQERVAVESPVELIGWLDSVRAVARAMVDAQVRLLRDEATARGLGAVLAQLDAGRPADAFLLLHEDRGDRRVVAPLRESKWRAEARAAYANPAETIAAETDEPFTAWSRHGAPQNDGVLRLAFAKAIFGELAEVGKAEHEISCQRLRDHLSDLNPTFLPQLTRFQKISLLVAPSRPGAPDFVNATTALVSKYPHSLVIVLAPRLKERVRQEVLAEFRKAGRTAALVDDLDLCRVFDLGGRRRHLPLALLEIALEQLPWSSHLTPFSTADGQNTLVEMYVGRRAEANRIALTPECSRIFSGRKLGKSALLKFIRDRFDGHELPSGNKLRVLLISAVGAENEGYVVQLILDELKRRFGLFVPGISVQAPVERLVRTADKFVQERSRESLLIVLDEADQFVSAQVEANDQYKEKCLSWRMRTAIEGHEGYRDSQDFPRFRFLFSGYRATNATSGAWGNWGSVLTLHPLTPDDAATLVAGPLARLGIDASREAMGIAWRCGYQPAVLQQFGERLLQRLESRTPVNERDYTQVTASDVAEVFAEEAVRNEIRTVVRNNFQDSARARVVFYALTKAFADQPPGFGFADPTAAVQQVLESVDQDLSWLHPEPDARTLEFTRMLADFTQRQLLVRKNDKLHFRNPHHLSIILPPDPAAFLRQEIRGLRQRNLGASDQPVRALVPETELLNLRRLITEDPDPLYPVTLVVVGTHWPEAFGDGVGGLPARLGLNPEETVDPTVLLKEAKRKSLAVAVRARLKLADRLAQDRPKGLPPPLFIGGADLLREVLLRQRDPKRFEAYELCTPGRLEPRTIWWWFERVRGLGFSTNTWTEDVMQATGGIPLLVRQFDAELTQAARASSEIADPVFRSALQATNQSIPTIAVRLGSNGDKEEFKLTAREIELMRMIHHVAVTSMYDTPRLLEDLSDSWDVLYGAKFGKAFDPNHGGDRTSLEMLVRLGLLRENRTILEKDDLARIVLPPQDDPFHAIAKALGSA